MRKMAMGDAGLLMVSMLLSCSASWAQEKELIDQDALHNFRPVEMWSLAGGVTAVEGEKALAVTSGNSILYNGVKYQRAPYLYTQDEFRDVALSIQFMVPKGSNAGVYFFGRYEIQIFDSYGREKVKYSDLGGVYQRWRDLKEGEEKGTVKWRGYEGAAPWVNAAKAPGEWQQMDIVFRAPRFDATGKKIENARFVSVHVNGQQVQENVEVTGPTRAAPQSGDVAKGPIAIQGDHGPVAIRSMRVTPLNLDDCTAFAENWEPLFKGNGADANYRKFIVQHMETEDITDLDKLMTYDAAANELRVLYDWEHDAAPYAMLLTKDTYSSYDLKFEYKWGERTFKPRAEHKRDAGVLIHVHDPVENTKWSKSLECQVQESDTGDFIMIGCQATPLDKAGQPQDPGSRRRYYRTFRKYGLYETDGWNAVLVKVREDGARFYVNGHLVNEFIKPELRDPPVPLTEGFIGLQAEGAELTYRNILIRKR